MKDKRICDKAKKKSNQNNYPIKNIPLFVKGTKSGKFHQPQKTTRLQHNVMIQQLEHNFKGKIKGTIYQNNSKSFSNISMV